MGFDPISYAMGAKAGGGGGGGVTVEPLSVTANGEYTAPSNKAYSPVTVDVFQMQSYATNLVSAFEVYYSHGTLPEVPKELDISAPFCTSISSVFRQYLATPEYSLGIETVTLRMSSSVDGSSAFMRNSSIKVLNFPEGVTFRSSISQMLDGNTALEQINGTITIGANTNYGINQFAGTALKSIAFTPSTLTGSVKFASEHLSDISLISIANGLSDTVTGMTLTHDATAKARCGQIVGTVTDGVFTQDAGGTVTLTDFITQTKGWTLA